MRKLFPVPVSQPATITALALTDRPMWFPATPRFAQVLRAERGRPVRLGRTRRSERKSDWLAGRSSSEHVVAE